MAGCLVEPLPRSDSRADSRGRCVGGDRRTRKYPGRRRRRIALGCGEPRRGASVVFCITTSRPGFSLRPNMPHTSRLPRQGCDHPCTFCIIPQLRGKFRSRRFESVVREAENLAAAGVREVTLIGQDTTSYGEDLGLRDGLALLLERLAGVEGLQWVRSLYCYPNRVTSSACSTPSQRSTRASQITWTWQAGCKRRQPQRPAARMKRGIEWRRRVPCNCSAACCATIPGVALRTSFIVGFPGRNRMPTSASCAIS